MIFLVVALLIIISVIGLSRYKAACKRTAEIESIGENWGKPTENYRAINLVANYHNYLKKDTSIADNIAADIDLENVFTFVDRTSSKIGQQYLYHTLRTPGTDIRELEALNTLVNVVTNDEYKRAALQMELVPLNNANAYYLHELFSSAHSPLYSGGLSLYIRMAGVLWIVALMLTIITHAQALFLLTMGLTLFNFFIHYSNKKNILRYVHSLPQLFTLMRVSKYISNHFNIPENEAIVSSLKKAGSLSRSLRFVKLEDRISGDPSDLAYALWELLKTVLLIEPAMFIASINKVNQYRDDIEVLFNYVGRVDMAVSIQSFRLSLPYFCLPGFGSDSHNLSVNGLYHPLVDHCVANSFQTSDSQGVLVTGSNMSGKTTFIRAMAVNALLSQTLFTACAESYEAPLLQLFTSIRVSDDMEEHKSYFQAEALSVLNIMNQSKHNPVKSLVIIDEIFRGTNTIERVAAAKAILSYFTANQSFVFVSTHDLELAELLGDEYAVYCFEETVADTRLVFDYKIKPGILKNKNAIAIMAALGYPESVIADAYAMNEQLRERYKI
jgi:hypothetical protein